MIFTTQLELNITIKDINAIYSTNYDQMLLDHAKLMYERKCRDGQYVKSIDELVKRSLPNLIRRDLNAKVRVYIVVKATVIRYDQYDYVTGMKIMKVIPSGKISNFDMIECRNDHVVALMKIQKGVEDFKVGDIIPIGVGQSMYKIGNSHILVNGYPFVPYVPDTVEYTFSSITEADKKYYQAMIISLLEAQLNRKKTLDQDRWNMFSDLMYPFKSKAKEVKGVSIFDIDTKHTGPYGIDYHQSLSNLKIYSDLSKRSQNVITLHEDTKTALTRIVFQFVKHIELINNLVEQYPTDDSFNKVKYIWDAYNEEKH